MKIFARLLLLLLVFSWSSCNSYKRIPYMMDSESLTVEETDKANLYDARIMPKDLLTITVSSTEPEAAIPFNLTIPTIQSTQTRSLTSQPVLQTYLVDNSGDVEFPVLGRIHLGGLTKSEAEKYIVDKLKGSFKETPIVNVRLVNYKVSVLGEVNRPGTFTVANEKINLFEALALAGDMSVYGKRDNVKLLREDNKGRKEIVTLDLNKSDIINSPYFYLQQNDVIYVEPNKAKSKNADIGQSTTLLLSGTSILISLASLIVNIVR